MRGHSRTPCQCGGRPLHCPVRLYRTRRRTGSPAGQHVRTTIPTKLPSNAAPAFHIERASVQKASRGEATRLQPPERNGPVTRWNIIMAARENGPSARARVERGGEKGRGNTEKIMEKKDVERKQGNKTGKPLGAADWMPRHARRAWGRERGKWRWGADGQRSNNDSLIHSREIYCPGAIRLKCRRGKKRPKGTSPRRPRHCPAYCQVPTDTVGFCIADIQS